MVSACLEALRVHDDRSAGWTQARWAFDWFLGAEPPAALALRSVDRRLPRRAARRSRPIENQGAESDALVPARACTSCGRSLRVDRQGVAAQTFRPSVSMMSSHRYETLFHRHEGNPILSAASWPYPAHTVFNPGATRLRDGTTLLLCRVEDRRGHSHLCAARSANGVDGWVGGRGADAGNRTPSGTPRSCGGSRIRASPSSRSSGNTRSPTLRSARADRASRSRSPRTSGTSSASDFIMQPDDKDAALLPRRIDGNFALLHRPMTDTGAHVWMSFSPDLRNWGNHKLVLQARKGS